MDCISILEEGIALKRQGKYEEAKGKYIEVINNVRRMVCKYCFKAGINKNISPHTFRHTYASDLLRATKNIRLVQKALGHEDLSTTMIYTHIVDNEFEEALKKLRG